MLHSMICKSVSISVPCFSALTGDDKMIVLCSCFFSDCQQNTFTHNRYAPDGL